MNNDAFSYLNLNNNISDMFFEENSSIFLCIYNISFIKEDLPFIQYLLYKQELQLNNKKHRLASFPYIHFEENREKTLINVKNLVTNLTEGQSQFNGFIKDNSNFYLFYNHLHPIQNKTYNLTDDIIWGTIHVIVNQQKILATPSWQPITPPIPPHIPPPRPSNKGGIYRKLDYRALNGLPAPILPLYRTKIRPRYDQVSSHAIYHAAYRTKIRPR